jgi:hypothetical protein
VSEIKHIKALNKRPYVRKKILSGGVIMEDRSRQVPKPLGYIGALKFFPFCDRLQRALVNFWLEKCHWLADDHLKMFSLNYAVQFYKQSLIDEGLTWNDMAVPCFEANLVDSSDTEHFFGKTVNLIGLQIFGDLPVQVKFFKHVLSIDDEFVYLYQDIVKNPKILIEN